MASADHPVDGGTGGTGPGPAGATGGAAGGATGGAAGGAAGGDAVLREAVAPLAAVPDRGSARPGELAAAEWLVERFRSYGLRARIEPERAHGTYWWPLGLPSAAGLAAGVSALTRGSRPAPGTGRRARRRAGRRLPE